MNIRRLIFYICAIIGGFMLQNNVFAACPLVETVPNILLVVTFTFGFLRGCKEGMTIGFFCGLLMDMFFGNILGFYALMYLVTGLVTGVLAKLFDLESVIIPIVFCIISDLVFNILVYAFGFLINGRTDFLGYFTVIILPEIIYTAILTPIIYWLLKRLDGWITEKSKRSADEFV